MIFNRKRLMNSFKADVIFQFKQGFYYIYIIISLIYIFVFSLLNDNVLQIVLPILIYIDPSVLGLFFIGGMVLLEKEQGILSLLYITPLRVMEYIISKVISLGLLSVITSFIISLLSYRGYVNHLYLFLGILLTSIFFTLFGFLLSSNVKDVKTYLVNMVPWMLIIIIPCLSLIPNNFVPDLINLVLNVVPSVAGLKIVMGAYSEIATYEIVICFASLIIFDILLLKRAKKVLTKKVILNS